jgi:AraC-like DNA-binding protein
MKQTSSRGEFRTQSDAVRPAPGARPVIDDAGTACRAFLYPQQQLSLLGDTDRFAPVQHFSRLGPVTLGDVSVGTDVRLDCGELTTSYHVNLPITGRLASQHRGKHVTATPGRAAVYRPDGDTVITRWDAACRLLVLKIDRSAVGEALEDMLGRPVTSQVAFEPSMDTTGGAARSWTQLLLVLNSQLADQDGLDSVALHPMVAAPLAESLVHGFLLSAEHPYRESLAAPGKPVQPVAVRTARELIEGNPRAPMTTASLARQCHVSVRSLQEGFQRHVGMSPTAYIREVRLRGAHEDLLTADPYLRTVASVAEDWGFTHLGRFAAAHEARYGQLPLRTLHATK